MLYVRWFPRDYLQDTIHLSWLEDCAYRRLLDLYYTKGGALTTDREKLYQQVRANNPEEVQAVESVIKQYFFRRGKNLHNSRANAELVRTREIISVRAKGGKQRAKKAAQAQHKLSSSSAILDTDTDTDAERPNLAFSQVQSLGVPLSLWAQFKNLRERLHRPIVSGAEDHIFAELIELKGAGEDPVEVLTRAVRTSSWKLSANHKPKGETNERERRSKAAIERAIQETD